jgi:Uncharacterized protein conserved in bacteria
MTANDPKQTLKALRTCRGQLDGIISMIETGRGCMEVSNQVLAAQAMLKRANKLILVQHLETCLKAAVNDPAAGSAGIDELEPLLNKLLEP